MKNERQGSKVKVKLKIAIIRGALGEKKTEQLCTLISEAMKNIKK